MDSCVLGIVVGQSEFTLLASRPALWSPAVSEHSEVNHGCMSVEEHLQ